MRRALATYVIVGCVLQLVLLFAIHMMVRWEQAYISQLHAPNPPPPISRLSMGSVPAAYAIPLLISGGLVVALAREAPDRLLADLLGAVVVTTVFIALVQIIGFLALFWGMWASGIS